MADAAELRPAPFETEVFGRPVLTLVVDGSAGAGVVGPAVGARLADLGAGGWWLVSARVPADDPALADVLTGHGFRAIEELVTLRRPLAPMPVPAGIRRATLEDAEPCAAIARQAFRSDRFHADPRVDDERADELKARWARNDVDGRAELSLVHDEGAGLQGFNLCLLRGDDLVIDLIAVAPDRQGAGIGRALVEGAFALAPVGVRTVTVGTQATNVASLALYARAGFEPIGRATTFHLVAGCP